MTKGLGGPWWRFFNVPSSSHSSWWRLKAKIRGDGSEGLAPAPPVVQSVDQSAACVQERVGVFITVASDPAGTDSIVESERLQVGLVGEIERQGHVTEPDEPQIAVDLRDVPTRKMFASRDRRAASGIADPEAA